MLNDGDLNMIARCGFITELIFGAKGGLSHDLAEISLNGTVPTRLFPLPTTFFHIRKALPSAPPSLYLLRKHRVESLISSIFQLRVCVHTRLLAPLLHGAHFALFFPLLAQFPLSLIIIARRIILSRLRRKFPAF